ncbi:MAG: hypothetical protein P4L90_28975 [Rhodopila sp.]|nr:hypothetical protein [Rhodopila sp.]
MRTTAGYRAQIAWISAVLSNASKKVPSVIYVDSKRRWSRQGGYDSKFNTDDPTVLDEVPPAAAAAVAEADEDVTD